MASWSSESSFPSFRRWASHVNPLPAPLSFIPSGNVTASDVEDEAYPLAAIEAERYAQAAK